MRAAVYARVSTRDRDQDPETQLMALRDYCEAKGWHIVEEFVDEAPGMDLHQRVAWRKLLDQATKRQFKTVVVWKLDRAFRSVRDMHLALAAWESQGIEFESVTERLDTTSAMGRMMMNFLAVFAEFEAGLISERVVAGMARARAQGKRLGRPNVEDYRYCIECGPPFAPGHFRHNGLARRGHKPAETVGSRFDRAGGMTLRELAERLVLSRRSTRRLIDRAKRGVE